MTATVAYLDLSTLESGSPDVRSFDPWVMVENALSQRKDSYPVRLYAGRNWPFGRNGFCLHWTPGYPQTMEIEANGTDDTVLVWPDGQMHVLRMDNEPDYRNSPVSLGKAGASVGNIASRSTRKAGKKGRK